MGWLKKNQRQVRVPFFCVNSLKNRVLDLPIIIVPALDILLVFYLGEMAGVC
jgi:hypothetical protein